MLHATQSLLSSKSACYTSIPVGMERYLEIHFQADCHGENLRLCYLRNKDGREIDFLVTRDGLPKIMIEVKWTDGNISPNFKFFEKYLPKVSKIQLVKELKREKTYPDGAQVRKAHDWLAGIDFLEKRKVLSPGKK